MFYIRVKIRKCQLKINDINNYYRGLIEINKYFNKIL